MDYNHLSKAVKNENLDFIKTNFSLLSIGQKVNLFYYAVSMGKFESIKTLISLQCPIKTSRVGTRFKIFDDFVKTYDRPDILEAFSHYPINLNMNEYALLKSSVENQNLKSTSYLLTQVNEIDNDHVLTSLHKLIQIIYNYTNKNKIGIEHPYYNINTQYPLICEFKKHLTEHAYESLLEKNFPSDNQCIIQLRYLKIQNNIQPHLNHNVKKVKI